MNISQILLEALESLNGNKMRSGLTILGIVIGVAAVIAMLAVGNGAQDSILGSINDIGTNLLFVFEGNDDADVRNPRPLTMGDAEAHRRSICRAVGQAVAPVVQSQEEVTAYGEKDMSRCKVCRRAPASAQ